MAENLNNIVFIDKSGFACAAGFDPCDMKERTISYALRITVPEQIEPPAEVFKECCYYNFVLASSTSDEPAKNDTAGFFALRQASNETNLFVLIRLSDNLETDLNDNTLGTFQDFGSIADNPDLTTFVLDWKAVLLAQGEDDYKVVRRATIAGVPIEIEYFVYTLREFSDTLADKTVRFDCTMAGLLEKPGIDFTGSNFSTSLRVPGFFGRREPAYEEDNIINRNYVKRQVSSKQTNEYRLQTNLVPDCITEEIIDFILFSDDVRINDYNLNNHSYNYKNFPVKLASNEGTEYNSRSRKAILNLVFNDKTVNNNKRNY